MTYIKVSYLESLRASIEEQYRASPTNCGGSFGELLCYEIHSNNLTFSQLAKKWGLPVTTIGELIYDHCKKLENLPNVNHKFRT